MTEHEVIIEFELKDEKITNSTDKIISTFESLKNSFSQNVNQTVSKGLQDLARQSNKVSKPLKQIKDHSKASALSIGALATSTIMATKKIIQLTNESANFIGVQTRFNSIFGTSNEELKEAQKWVKEYSEALYLDSKEVMNINSSLALLAKNLGFSNKKSSEMSRNLTQLAYDMSAVAGTSLDETFTAIRSGLGGEAEALKKYGVYLNQATLQNTLYANGINRTVSSLNAAEKAELAYYQIMKTTAGQQGYLAKTLMSPANAANILKTQFTLLGRSIGNLFLPILMKLLPVVVAVTQALTRMAEALAAFFGINIDFSDYGSDIGGISSGIDGIGDSADGASKKIKNMLRDFDDLHVVDFGDDSDSGGGIGGIGGAGGLGLDVQQYADWSKYLDDINTKLSISKEWVSAIVGGLAGLTIGGIVGKILELIGVLKGAKKWGFILGTTLAGIGIGITFDAAKDIDMNGLNAKNIIETVMGALANGGGTALTLMSLGVNPMLSLKIGLLVSIGTIAFNIGIGIGNWLKEKLNLPERFEHYIKEFDLNIDEDGFFTSAKKVAQILFSSIRDAILEKFPNFKQVMSDLGRWIVMGLITGLLGFIAGVPGLIFGGIILLFNIIVDTLENVFDMHSPSKKMMEYGKYIILGIIEGIGSLIGKAGEKIIQLKDEVIKKIQQLITDFKLKIDELKSSVSTKITQIVEDIKTKWRNFVNGFSPISDWWNNKISPWFSKEKWKNLASNAVQGIKNAFSNLDIKLKMPHFTWTSTPASGWIAKTLSALSLPTSLPKLKVDWYADGGFPNKGDLFIANEREPELIGTMGNKTTVANGMQIIEGIASASYSGMKRALQEVDWGSGDTLVYVGNKQLTDVVTKQQNFNSKKYGR